MTNISDADEKKILQNCYTRKYIWNETVSEPDPVLFRYFLVVSYNLAYPFSVPYSQVKIITSIKHLRNAEK